MAQADKAPLGVGNLIGDVYGLFFRNFLKFLAIVFAPLLVLVVVTALFVGVGTSNVFAEAALGAPTASAIAGIVAYILLAIVTFFVITAMVTLAAYDIKLGEKISITRYVSAALRSILPIILCGLLVALVFVAASFIIGGITTFLPTIWLGPAVGTVLVVVLFCFVMTRFSVMLPAIIIERLGISGFSRSLWLTKSYFWPVLGAVLLNAVVLFVISLLLTLAVGLIGGIFGATANVAGGSGAASLITVVITIVLNLLVSCVTFALPAIFAALLYARLREIKEGTGMEDLVTVFE